MYALAFVRVVCGSLQDDISSLLVYLAIPSGMTHSLKAKQKSVLNEGWDNFLLISGMDSSTLCELTTLVRRHEFPHVTDELRIIASINNAWEIPIVY